MIPALPSGAVFIHKLCGITIIYQARAERHRVNKLNGKKGINMTRNDIKALFPEATKEAIDQLLDINSTDIGKAVNKGQTTQEQLEAQIKGLNEQITTLNAQAKDLNAQIKGLTDDVAKRDSTIKTLTDEKETAINEIKAQYEVDTKNLNDTHAGELKSLQDQLTAATERAKLADTLTDRVTKLTQEVADRDATIANNNKEYRVKDVVRNRHAKNVDIVYKMLDTSKITEEEGKLNGLDEQLDALEKSDSYLFDSNTGNQRGGVNGNPDVGNSTGANDAVNQAIRSLSGRG